MQGWQGVRAVLTATMIAVGGPIGAASASDQDEILSPDDLEGTIWVGEELHRRVTVSPCGDVTIKEGKDIYLHFKQRVDDIFVIEVRWWNEEAGINVLEYGVLSQIAPNEYHYVEADHPDPRREPDAFPGIVGQGTFELLADDRAKLIQVGNLIDGSASGFTTFLVPADELPHVPIEQTYPLFCRP
jgi:hypothetical protein